MNYGIPIHLAALKGDWESVKGTFKQFPDAVRARITMDGATALHVAAGEERTPFVIELVKLMHADDLALQDESGNTALHIAAISGKVQLAKVLVDMNASLPMIRCIGGNLPLFDASFYGRSEIMRYLYPFLIQSELVPEERIELLTYMIDLDVYDIALDMLEKNPDLATARNTKNETALHALARRPLKLSCITTQTTQQLGWRRFFSGINQFQEKTLMNPMAIQFVTCLWEQMILLDNTTLFSLIRSPWNVLLVASKKGNVNLIVTLIRLCPDLIWMHDHHKNGSIFHAAVKHRHENIFSLINGMGALKNFCAKGHAKNKNNMLHMAGMLAPPKRLNLVSGAAFQMQRELLWFKEVEKFVLPRYVAQKNSHKKTPRVLFTESHKDLKEAGKKWMKGTATFAAAFTLPGGNTDTGIPIYRRTIPFTLFAISDAIALLCSSTSTLIFLSILTSRYAEEDFLASLPVKLIIGLALLVMSVATMMVAFCSTFFIVFYNGVKWISTYVAVIACVVFLFGCLEYRLVSDVMYSTYSSRYLFTKSKQFSDVLF